MTADVLQLEFQSVVPKIWDRRGSYIVFTYFTRPIGVPGSGHTGKQIYSFRRFHPYARKSASKAVLHRMQLSVHATRPTSQGASRLVQEMSAWSVRTRRAPSRHCGDARVRGRTTTAMHDMTTPRPLTPVSYTHLTLPTIYSV